jgi:hypothetical protein
VLVELLELLEELDGLLELVEDISYSKQSLDIQDQSHLPFNFKKLGIDLKGALIKESKGRIPRGTGRT